MGACHEETTYTTRPRRNYLPCKVQMRQGEMLNKPLPMYVVVQTVGNFVKICMTTKVKMTMVSMMMMVMMMMMKQGLEGVSVIRELTGEQRVNWGNS